MKPSLGLVILFACMSVASMLKAQPKTMSGFVAGAVTQENTYSVLGQPFVGTSEGNGYQVTEGIAQTQLVREEYSEAVNYSAGYDAHGFHYPMSTAVGFYHDYLYYGHGAPYHYDFVKVLNLEVVAIPCGDDVYDVDNNMYPTVAVAGYCWTKKNLMVEHYPDGVTLIPGTMVYSGNIYNNVESNLITYGRLYTWYSTVNVPEDGSAEPVPDGDGYVQGICPDGWHIPTTTEMTALLAIPLVDLRSQTLWVGVVNTNSTGFSALPAGLYKSSAERFEGLLTFTDFWTDTHPSTAAGTTIPMVYYCEEPVTIPLSPSDALSVRCVRNM